MTELVFSALRPRRDRIKCDPDPAIAIQDRNYIMRTEEMTYYDAIFRHTAGSFELKLDICINYARKQIEAAINYVEMTHIIAGYYKKTGMMVMEPTERGQHFMDQITKYRDSRWFDKPLLKKYSKMDISEIDMQLRGNVHG